MILKKRVSDEIFEQMKQRIFSGQWIPGGRLPSEQKLMEEFGASRISIREPLKQLAGLGLVESRRGAGTFVRAFNEDAFIAPIHPMLVQTLTKQDVLYILEARQVEVVAAGLAAMRADRHGVELLRQIHEKIEVEHLDYHAHISADYDFHMQICKMANNPYFYQICKLLQETLGPALESIVRIMGPEKARFYHPKLVSTIENGYAHEARAVMQEHLDTTVEAVRLIPEGAEVFLNKKTQ